MWHLIDSLSHLFINWISKRDNKLCHWRRMLWTCSLTIYFQLFLWRFVVKKTLVVHCYCWNSDLTATNSHHFLIILNYSTFLVQPVVHYVYHVVSFSFLLRTHMRNIEGWCHVQFLKIHLVKVWIVSSS